MIRFCGGMLPCMFALVLLGVAADPLVAMADPLPLNDGHSRPQSPSQLPGLPLHRTGRPLRVLTVATGGGDECACPHCALGAAELARFLYLTRFRARGLSAPAVHTATPTSRASGSVSGSGSTSGSGVLNWAGDQLVVAPQGCWLHSALGHLDEGETRRPTPSQSADDKESHTLRTVRRGDGGNTSWTYVLSGTTSVGTLHAVYSFAEDVLGVRFYPHGDVVPSSSADASASLPDIGHRHYAAQFDVRGANTWGTWTEGFDWWTVDNWRGFITQLTKMKMNFIGMHSYPLEPTVWVGSPTELDPTGERVVDPYPASYTTTLKHAFSYQPKNTSEYTGGGALAFPTECCCGVSAAATDRCPIPLNACAAAAVFNDQAGVMASAFSWAARYGVATALGTETPVVQAHEQLNGTGGLTNASAASAEVLYRGIFAHLNATLGHNLTYYWFWTPEGYSWSKYPHNSSQWDLAIGDMLAGHAVWGEAAWPFELATAGWTLGPKDDPAYLDRVLPTDGFKALSGLTYKVGRDPDEFGSSTSTGYANVTRRPAWIMPWMESDDALGWPELWVNRTLDIANRAAGTKGLVGLQWRTEEVMPQFSALAQRGWDAALTSDVFWADFAVANFGLEVAPEIATILASVDGDRDSVDARAMPFFTSCCPGAIKSPNKQPWSELSTQFTFVDDLVALRPKVNGTANVGRFDSWLHNFEYLRQGGQISCLFNNYTLANAHAMAIADPQQRLTALRQTVVPLRQAMVDVWEKLTAHQLQAVGTRGAMGTIQNMEAISKHALLDAPGEALTAALGAGAILPQPTMAYTGSDRVFLPNLRTVIADAESLLIEAVVLSKSPPTTVALYYRTVSSDAGHQSMLSAWTPTPLTQTTAGRGVWTVRSEPATHPEHRDVESRGGVDGWLQIVECSSPAAGPWVFMPSGALSLNGSACLGPGGGSLPVNSSTGCLGEMALSACTATSPAWEVTSAPGFPTIALKGVVGSWGPAAVAGNVVVGTAVFLCTLTGSNEQYCAAHHSCDYRYDPAAKRLIHEQSQLCLGTGPKQGPTPPTPPFGPCTVPPTPPPPPPGTWRLNGSITEYFVAATFDDGAVVTYPPGSFVGNIRDGDTVTVVVESR